MKSILITREALRDLGAKVKASDVAWKDYTNDVSRIRYSRRLRWLFREAIKRDMLYTEVRGNFPPQLYGTPMYREIAIMTGNIPPSYRYKKLVNVPTVHMFERYFSAK